MISAFGPLHDRQAPPPGRQRAARRHSRPLSGSQRAFQTRGCTPGYPPKSEKVPVNAVSQCRRPRPVRRTGACLTAIERARERSLGCCSEPTTAPGHRATGRVRGSSSSRRSAVAPAISAFGPLQRPPSTATWPSVGRSASQSASQRPLSAFQTRGCTPGYPPKSEKMSVNAISQRRCRRPVHRACIPTSNNNSTPALRRRRGTLQLHDLAYTDPTTGYAGSPASP